MYSSFIFNKSYILFAYKLCQFSFPKVEVPLAPSQVPRTSLTSAMNITLALTARGSTLYVRI